MPGRADDILFSIRADNKDIKKKLSEVQTDMKHMGKAGHQAGDMGAQGVNKLSRALKALVTGSIILVIVKGLYELGKAALFGSDQLQQQRIALETMTGSAKTAGKVIREVKDFSAKTPFQLPGLIETSKQLIAFGVDSDDVVQKMENLGNAAQGNQEKFERLSYAYGKIRAKGKASMEELNMLTEAGVPILDELANQYNVSTQQIFKMVETGKVGFAEVDEALTSLTTGSGRFAGMLEKQSKTIGGMFSTLVDKIKLVTMEIGNAMTPAIEHIFDIFPETKEEMEEVYKYARLIGRVFGTIVLIIKTWADALLSIPALFRSVFYKIDIRIKQLKLQFADLMYSVGIGSEEAVHKAGNALVGSAKKYAEAQKQIRESNEALKGDVQAIIDLWGEMDEKTSEEGAGTSTGKPKTGGAGTGPGGKKEGWNPWFDAERIKQDLEKIQQSLVDSYNPVQSLGNAFQGLEDASRQATYDMLWGENGWKNFQESMKEIFKKLVADVAYYTAKVIAMKAAVDAISGGDDDGLLASVFEKGRVPVFANGRIPAYPTGRIPDDHFLAYIGAREAVMTKEATRANADILKAMNSSGQRYQGEQTFRFEIPVMIDGKEVGRATDEYRNQVARRTGMQNYGKKSFYGG